MTAAPENSGVSRVVRGGQKGLLPRNTLPREKPDFIQNLAGFARESRNNV